MLYLIGPNRLINLGYANFRKNGVVDNGMSSYVWDQVPKGLRAILENFHSFFFSFLNFHSLILNLGLHIILIHAVFFGKFAYPQFTRYAEYIRFSHKEHLKDTYFLP